MNIQQEPIYNPKMSYIYQKINIGPSWSKLSGRGKSLFQHENYITNLSFNEAYSSINDIKGFIDMAKQTQRNGFPKNGDIRQRCEKKFEPLNKSNSIKKAQLSQFYKTAPIQKGSLSPFSENRTTRYMHKNNIFNVKEAPLSYRKGLTHRSQSVPDFNSYLSREKLNKLFKKQDRIANGVLFPNYKSIEERVKMMVVYAKKAYNKLNNNKKEFKGISSDEVYNANEAYEKIYGNKIRAVPLFQKMKSRPEDNDLPFFLNGITNRMGYYFSTDKALKMNNYSNSKLYNLCNELDGGKTKYKNSHLNNLRKSLGFDNDTHYDKNKVNRELEIKSKKFYDLIDNIQK